MAALEIGWTGKQCCTANADGQTVLINEQMDSEEQ